MENDMMKLPGKTAQPYFSLSESTYCGGYLKTQGKE